MKRNPSAILLRLLILMCAGSLIGCDTDKSHVATALQGLHSLESMTKTLEGSSTRVEYFRMYESKRDEIAPAIENVRDHRSKELLANVLNGYKLIAERWDPVDRKEATELALVRTITIAALPVAEHYATGTAEQRLEFENRISAKKTDKERAEREGKEQSEQRADHNAEDQPREETQEEKKEKEEKIEYWRKKSENDARRIRELRLNEEMALEARNKENKAHFAKLLAQEKAQEEEVNKFISACPVETIVCNTELYDANTANAPILSITIPINSDLRIIKYISNTRLLVSYSPEGLNRAYEFEIDTSRVKKK